MATFEATYQPRPRPPIPGMVSLNEWTLDMMTLEELAKIVERFVDYVDCTRGIDNNTAEMERQYDADKRAVKAAAAACRELAVYEKCGMRFVSCDTDAALAEIKP